MLQIQKLQDCLKAKRKYADPKSLLDIVNQVKTPETTILVSLTQKGIILQMLAKVCYHQYGLFSKGLFMFYDSLKCGSFGNDKQKVTVKKKRMNGQRGNTTTAKKKKSQNPQITRHVVNLDEILQKQLSSPNNTQPKSQHSDHLSKQKEPIQLPTIQRLDAPLWQSQQYMTPLKQVGNQEQKENNLDQYRSIINIQSKNKTKTAKTKNKQQTAKTRKKLKNTQPIPQQINGEISIENTSQLSLRLQIQNVLQATKKKKNKDKDSHNYHNHQIFKMAFQENKQILDKRQNIKKFFEENYDKFKRGTTALDNYGYSQHSNRLNFVNQPEDNEYYENLAFGNKSEQIFKTLDEQINKNKNIKFSIISQNLGINAEEKASFFYELLCSTEKYQLYQHEVVKFGQISISLCKNTLF